MFVYTHIPIISIKYSKCKKNKKGRMQWLTNNTLFNTYWYIRFISHFDRYKPFDDASVRSFNLSVAIRQYISLAYSLFFFLLFIHIIFSSHSVLLWVLIVGQLVLCVLIWCRKYVPFNFHWLIRKGKRMIERWKKNVPENAHRQTNERNPQTNSDVNRTTKITTAKTMKKIIHPNRKLYWNDDGKKEKTLLILHSTRTKEKLFKIKVMPGNKK